VIVGLRRQRLHVGAHDAGNRGERAQEIPIGWQREGRSRIGRPTRVRSFAEFRLTRALHARGLPVPRPLAASYRRRGASYRAAILVERLEGVHSLAERIAVAGADAPWEESGRLIARFHRAGLDHADLNAHNILFDVTGQGWMIDFDRCRLRIPDTAWRGRNLARLKRSLLKLRGAREPAVVKDDFARLRGAYDATWQRGY